MIYVIRYPLYKYIFIFIYIYIIKVLLVSNVGTYMVLKRQKSIGRSQLISCKLKQFAKIRANKKPSHLDIFEIMRITWFLVPTTFFMGSFDQVAEDGIS